MPVYQYIGWYLASSNSLKTQQYQYLYHPRTMIPADLYHQISPSLEWCGNGASYPFLNPSNFVEYPTIYDLSRPHLPYVARYPQDPSIRLDFSHQCHHPFRLDLKEFMCYKTWMEKQLNLYAVWDHFVRDINLHVSLIHIGNPLNDFNHTYMLHLDSHPDNPSILEVLLQRVYKARGWATYIMCHVVDLTVHDNNMSFLRCGVDENMIGTTIFEDSQVTIGDKVETLVHHGVPIFVVGFVHLHHLITLSLVEVKDEDEAKREEELMRSSSFLRKIFDIFVHLSSNRIGCISPWIIDHPHNLRENGNGSEVPVWWLGRELDLFSAHHYSGIPGGALYAVGKVFGWGCIEAPPLPDHNPQLMEHVNALMENTYCSPDALPDPEDLEVTQHNTEHDEDYDEQWQWEIAWTKEEQESYLGRKLLAGAILGSPTSLAEVQRLV